MSQPNPILASTVPGLALGDLANRDVQPVASGAVPYRRSVKPINVREDHGAFGNGMVVDSDAIDAALAACQATGAPAYFPSGIYLINRPIVIPWGVSLLGDGGYYDEVGTSLFNSAVVIRLAAGSNCDMIQPDPTAPIRNGAQRWQRSYVDGITLNGNKFAQTVAGAGFKLTNVWSFAFGPRVHCTQISGIAYDFDTCNEIKSAAALTANACGKGAYSFKQISDSIIWVNGGGASQGPALYLSGGTGSEFYGQAFNSNPAFGTLLADITDVQTAGITVVKDANSPGWPTWGGTILVGTERISYTGITTAGSNVTLTGVTRAAGGTVAAAHLAAAAVVEYSPHTVGVLIDAAVNPISDGVVMLRGDQNYQESIWAEGAHPGTFFRLRAWSPGWRNAVAQNACELRVTDALVIVSSHVTTNPEANPTSTPLSVGTAAARNVILTAFGTAFGAAPIAWAGSSKAANIYADNLTFRLSAFGLTIGQMTNGKVGVRWDETNTVRQYWQDNAHGLQLDNAHLELSTAGKGFHLKEGGAAARMGAATLVGGTVVVNTTGVTANSRILLTPQDNNTAGALRVSARTAGTSFTILSSNGADTGVVAWMIVEPSA